MDLLKIIKFKKMMNRRNELKNKLWAFAYGCTFISGQLDALSARMGGGFKNSYRLFSTLFSPSVCRLSSNSRKDNIINIWVDIWSILIYDDVQEDLRGLEKLKECFFSGQKVSFNNTYNITAKIALKDFTYSTLGLTWRAIVFNSEDDTIIKKFHYDISKMFLRALEEYEDEWKGEDIIGVLLEFLPVNVPEKIKIANLDDLKNLSPTNIKNIKREFKIFAPTLELKTRYFHDNSFIFKLDVYSKKEGSNFSFKLDESSDRQSKFSHLIHFFTEFNKLINSNPHYIFDPSVEFYLARLDNTDYIITVEKIRENIRLKKLFSNKGTFLTKVRDSQDRDLLIREIKNKTLHFNKKNELILLEKKIQFSPISGFKSKNTCWLPHTPIGTIDLETFEDDGLNKCYALGFYTYKDECKVYYINKDLDSVKLVHECFEELLRPKYKDILFYIHNLGKFDAPFIIKNLCLYNNTDQGKKNPYYFETITRDSDILSLTVKRKVEGKVRSIKIKDSVAILPNSLRNLGKDYKIEVAKSYFPYNFTKINTLFYIGQTPDIKYYKDISLDEYRELYKEVWSLKDECLLYLKKDLISLFQVLNQANKGFHLLFNVQMTESLTISGISHKIYLQKYYDKEKSPLPLILKREVWNDIHEAYYGGRVEVYNPRITGEVAYYYDVNSLYPYASLNPLPGLNCKYTEYLKSKPELKNLFGFFYCEVEAPRGKNYLGLLPYRTEKGSLIFPEGKWKGWYFSEELKFSAENHYQINVIKGYSFNKIYGAFTNFVKDIYEIKSKPKNDTEKNLSKLILNSQIGRYGMDFLKSTTKLVNRKTLNEISISKVVKNVIEINDNTFLVTYIPVINKEVVESFNIDIIKFLNSNNVKEYNSSKSFKSVSISTAAAVISYARIYIGRVMLDVINKGGKVYYTDTDSIVTNIKLPDNLQNNQEIGKFKLEQTVSEAYFIGDKTYITKSIEDVITKKAKGVNSSSLSFDDYAKMYRTGYLDTGRKTSSVRDYGKGSVVISDKAVNLNFCYRKREKIYNHNGEWIGTKIVNLNSKNPLALIVAGSENKRSLAMILYNTPL